MADEKQRDEVMDDILKYNQEDLQAPWQVFQLPCRCDPTQAVCGAGHIQE